MKSAQFFLCFLAGFSLKCLFVTKEITFKGVYPNSNPLLRFLLVLLSKRLSNFDKILARQVGGEREEVVEMATPKSDRRVWVGEESDCGSSQPHKDVDLFTNYRRNFPDHSGKWFGGELELPQIYKEKILLEKSEGVFRELWQHLKPKRKTRTEQSHKFTVNRIYDCQEVRRHTLSQNIALHNTMNSKTNLLEDTIYECSEDDNSLYHNPIYTAATTKIAKYYDFHTNHLRRTDSFVRRRCRLAKLNSKDPIKYRVKTEKYIIRHIKLRIMLSLKIGRLQRLCKREVNGNRTIDRQALLFKGGAECCENFGEERDTLRRAILQAHEEQRRIGNGRTSMKIQNMRYFRGRTKCTSPSV